jgi:hypothetical protein
MDRAMKNRDAPHIDFGAFRGVIASNPSVLPSDIDMILERHGYFLVGEWKHPGEEMSKGQLILLNSLAKNKSFVVLVIYGSTDNETEVLNFCRLDKNGMLMDAGNGLEELKLFIQRWYYWADKMK